MALIFLAIDIANPARSEHFHTWSTRTPSIR